MTSDLGQVLTNRGVHDSIVTRLRWRAPNRISAPRPGTATLPWARPAALSLWARRDEARRLAGLALVAVERGLMTADEADALRADRRPSGDRDAKRRRLAQLRYLEAVDADGVTSARAEALAAAIPGPSAIG